MRTLLFDNDEGKDGDMSSVGTVQDVSRMEGSGERRGDNGSGVAMVMGIGAEIEMT